MLPARRSPAFSMFTDPVEQGALETDVVAEAFGLQPLVFKNLLPLRQELLVETGLFDELTRVRGLLGRRSHANHAVEQRGENEREPERRVNARNFSQSSRAWGGRFGKAGEQLLRDVAERGTRRTLRCADDDGQT